MFCSLKQKRLTIFRKTLSSILAFTFIFTSLFPPGYARAQVIPQTALNLPPPGLRITPSPEFTPTFIKGITVHPENPLRFDFIVNTGDTQLEGEALKKESEKLVKYFLAALTVPEDELWVNLSPYEKDRIIPQGFGITEMGRDLLAQDYILKQISASLMYPEDELGREFWRKVYQKAQEKYGTTEIPINTFNKVWIIPDKAVVYEKGNSAYVAESHLTVMLEEDYLALDHNIKNEKFGLDKAKETDAKISNNISSEIIREVLIPEIEKEVNAGKNFAPLRQIYNAVILAVWYKEALKESLLGQIYANKNKVAGIDVADKDAKEKIYQQYLEAFKKGVYSYIRNDYDPVTNQVVQRKYFSGGTALGGPTQEALRRLDGNDDVQTPEETAAAKGIAQAGRGPDASVEIDLETQDAPSTPLGEPAVTDQGSAAPDATPDVAPGPTPDQTPGPAASGDDSAGNPSKRIGNVTHREVNAAIRDLFAKNKFTELDAEPLARVRQFVQSEFFSRKAAEGGIEVDVSELLGIIDPAKTRYLLGDTRSPALFIKTLSDVQFGQVGLGVKREGSEGQGSIYSAAEFVRALREVQGQDQDLYDAYFARESYELMVFRQVYTGDNYDGAIAIAEAAAEALEKALVGNRLDNFAKKLLRDHLAQINIDEDGLAAITINTAYNHYSHSYAHMERLIELVDEVANNQKIKALVFDGGKNFGVGADIIEILRNRGSADPRDVALAVQYCVNEKTLHEKIGSLSIPTITNARGYTIGGGLGIAAATKFIITDDSTVMAMPEIKIGLFPDVAATWFLPRRMGMAVGKYYGLTASFMTGKQAVGFGLAQGYVPNFDDFKRRLNELMASGNVTDQAVSSLIEQVHGTKKDLEGEVAELKAAIERYFNFGQHNQGYPGDIYTALEKGARDGDEFAQKALAAMVSGNPQSVWLSEFLIDTFSPEREEFVRKFNEKEAFTKEEARQLELKFVQLMMASPWFLEGVAGLMKGYVSREPNHLDTIILTDHKGFRHEVKAESIPTGSRLTQDAVVTYEGRQYTLSARDYHAGEKLITLTAADGSADKVTLRISLRNSQWSDQEVDDNLGVLRPLMEPKYGSEITKLAWLENPEKFELDMVYPYGWIKRPSRAVDLSKYPLNARFSDGKLNPAKAIFDQVEAMPDGDRMLDEIKITNIDDEGERDISLRQLKGDVYAMAHTLRRLGAAPGKTVLIYMSTTYEGMVVQLATALTGAVPHYLYSSKEADVLSYSTDYMGADIIITEDGYRQANKTISLKEEKVDKVLERFMQREEFQKRLQAALSDITDPSLAKEKERAAKDINAILEPSMGKPPTTYSRDDMQFYLQTTYTEYIREVVREALGEEEAIAFETRLMARADAIKEAKEEVEHAEKYEALWLKHKELLRNKLLEITPISITNDQELAQALLSNWLVLMRTIDAEEIAWKERNFLKDHIRLVANNQSIPTLDSLLSAEDRMELADFIVSYAQQRGLKAKDLEPIQRYDHVRNRIIAEFEKPYEWNVKKVLVYDRLHRKGFIEKIPMKEGRDISWDDALAETKKEIDTDDKLFAFEAHEFNGDDPIFESFSSGSMGAPKGILTEASALFSTAQSMRNSFALAPYEKHLTITDYGWIVGPVYALWAPLLEGRSFVLQSFTPTVEKVIDVIKRHKIAFLKAGSPFYDTFFPEIKRERVLRDLHTLLREGAPAICGCAAPFAYQTYRLMQNLLGQDALLNSLWPTETAGSVNATFVRRPSVERRMFETYRDVLSKLFGDEDAVKAVIAKVRTPVSMDPDHPDILPFPWTNQWVVEKLQDDEGSPIPNPQRIQKAINEGADRDNPPAIGQLVHAGTGITHTLGLMKSRRGVPGPALADPDFFYGAYFNHDYTVEFPGRGRGGVERRPLDTGDSAYLVTRHYDPADPFDFLVLDGPEDPIAPVTYYAAGRAGRQITNISGHLVNSQDFENKLDFDPRIKKSAATFVASGDRKGTKPVLVIALNPGHLPDDKLADDIITEVRTKVGAHLPVDRSDIIFLVYNDEPFAAGTETFLPFTRTNKIMYEVIAFFAEQDLDTLKKMQKFLSDPDLRMKMRDGNLSRLRASPLFKGMPDTQNLKSPLSITYLIDRIIIAREGTKLEKAKFDANSPQFDRFANVPPELIQKLGGKVLGPGDPLPPFQEYIGVTRNEDGMGMENRDVALGLRRGVRETPRIPAHGVLVQMIKGGNTHNVENLVTGDPTSQIGDKPEHVAGDAGGGIVYALSPEAENEGRFVIGQRVIVDPLIFNRHHPELTLNAQTDSYIGGYQGGGDQATFQPFAVFDSGSLYEVPVGMSLSQAATLLLNAPTVYHALFDRDKLDLKPDDILLVHGGTSDTGYFAITMAAALGAKILAYVKDEAAAKEVKTKHPNADIAFVYYKNYPNAFKTAPVDDPQALTEWLRENDRLRRDIPKGYEPTRVMEFLGGPYKGADFRLLAPSERGNAITWFSGMLGFYSTIVPFDGRLEANEALGEYGANVKRTDNFLSLYGANANEEGRDEFAIEAIKEAARLGGRVTVLTETDQQLLYLLAAKDVKGLVANRAESMETLKKQGIIIPEHFSNIDEGRFVPPEQREAHESWPGQEAETRFAVKTVSPLKKALSHGLEFNTNTSQLFDVIWYSGKRDRFTLGVYLSEPQIGRVVIGETNSNVVQTGHEGQGWFQQRTVIAPADSKRLQEKFGDAIPVRAKIIRVAGSHMYQPHEVQDVLDLVRDGVYRFQDPDHVRDQSEIEKTLGEKQEGKIRGSMAFNMVEGGDKIETEADVLRAQGIEVVHEFELVRLLKSQVGDNGESIAIIEINDQSRSNPNLKNKDARLRNKNLSYFKGDFVNQLRVLLDEVRKDPHFKVLLVRSDSTRAFVPGQNTTELKTLHPEDVQELAALAQDTMSQIESFPIPVSGDLGGLALGGGAELIAALHFVVASNVDRIKLGQVESVIGLPPGFGGTQRFVRILAENSKLGRKEGILAAADFVVTGDHMTMPEAYMHGLVSELVPANSWRRLCQHAVGQILGTDNTLQEAMERRHQAIDRWEQPILDKNGQPLDLSFITGDPHIQRYLAQADKVGGRGKIYPAILDLMMKGLSKGVRYGDEARAFGRFAGTLEFRQALDRFFGRTKLPTPPRRPPSLRQLQLIRRINAEVSAKPVVSDSFDRVVGESAPEHAETQADEELAAKIEELQKAHGPIDTDQWKGKTAVITGGGRGLGREVAFEYARAGANVVIMGRTLEDLQQTTADIKTSTGMEVTVVQGDVSKDEDIDRLFDVAEKKFGFIHYVIPNAGDSGDVKSLPMVPFKNYMATLMTHLHYWKMDSRYRRHVLEMRKKGNQEEGTLLGVGTHFSKKRRYGLTPYAFRTGGGYTPAQSAKVALSQLFAYIEDESNIASIITVPGPFDSVRIHEIVYPYAALIRHIEAGSDLDKAAEIRQITADMHAQGRFVKPQEVAKQIILMTAKELRSALNGEVLQMGGIDYPVPNYFTPVYELGAKPDLTEKRVILTGLEETQDKLLSTAEYLISLGAQVIVGTKNIAALGARIKNAANITLKEVDVLDEVSVSNFFENSSGVDHVFSVTGDPSVGRSYGQLDDKTRADMIGRYMAAPFLVAKYATAVMQYKALKETGKTRPDITNFQEFMVWLERDLPKERFTGDGERDKLLETISRRVNPKIAQGVVELVEKYLSGKVHENWTDEERKFLSSNIKRMIAETTSETEQRLLEKLLKGVKRIWTVEEKALRQESNKKSKGNLTVIGPDYSEFIDNTKEFALRRLRRDVFRNHIQAMFSSQATELAISQSQISVNVIMPGSITEGKGNPQKLNRIVAYLAAGRHAAKNGRINGAIFEPDTRNTADDWQDAVKGGQPVDLATRVVGNLGGAYMMGGAITDALAGAGANVVIASENETANTTAVTRVNAAGAGQATAVTLDLTNPDQIKALAAEIIRQSRESKRGIDLVNTSGVAGAFATSAEIPLADVDPATLKFGWETTMQINFLGPLELMARLLPEMRRQGGGSIFNIITLYRFLPYVYRNIYIGTKEAFGAFAVLLGEELKKEGINITNINPALIKGARLDLVLRGNILKMIAEGVLTPDMIERMNRDIDVLRKTIPRVKEIVANLEAKSETEIPRELLKPIAWFWTQMLNTEEQIASHEEEWGRTLTLVALYFKIILPLDPPTNEDVGRAVVKFARNPPQYAAQDVYVSPLEERVRPLIKTIEPNGEKVDNAFKGKTVLVATPASSQEAIDQTRDLVWSYLRAGASKVTVAMPRIQSTLTEEFQGSPKVQLFEVDYASEASIRHIFEVNSFDSAVYVVANPDGDARPSEIFFENDIPEDDYENQVIANRQRGELFARLHLTAPMLLLREATAHMDKATHFTVVAPVHPDMEARVAARMMATLAHTRNAEKAMSGKGLSASVLDPAGQWDTASVDSVVLHSKVESDPAKWEISAREFLKMLTVKPATPVAAVAQAEGKNPGGINIGRTRRVFQRIRRDDRGIPLPVNLQPIGDINIEGLKIRINSITPIFNLPLRLGINPNNPNDTNVGYEKELQKGRESEQLSLLN